MNPEISVIIPTFGRNKELKRAIDSVVSQTYENIEIIVVDDNDPDSEYRLSTEKIMAEYSDKRIVYLKHEKNKNGAAARNTGIRSAKGEYIAFLDDDDAFLPQKLEKQLDFLISRPDIDGAYCWYERENPHTPEKEGDLSLEILSCIETAPTPSLFLKKKDLTEIGGFNESFHRHQDFDLLLRYFKKRKIAPVKEILLKIGRSDGKNHMHGLKLEKLKIQFLDTFKSEINSYNSKQKRFIYARNFSHVFLDYLRRGPFKDAVRIFFAYFFKSPFYFTRECLKRIIK